MSARDRLAERFIAGEDRLSALLRALPAFEPSPSLADSVAAAARAAQADADRARAASAARPAANPAEPFAFTPPPELAASVLHEAARVQAAQAGRRDALLTQVAAGTPAGEALGGTVSAPTQTWLRQQAQAHQETMAQETAESVVRKRSPAHARRWWRSLGLAASTIAVAGLATHVVLRQIDEGVMLQEAAPVVAHREVADAPAPAAANPPDAKAASREASVEAGPSPQAAPMPPQATEPRRRAPAARKTPQAAPNGESPSVAANETGTREFAPGLPSAPAPLGGGAPAAPAAAPTAAMQVPPALSALPAPVAPAMESAPAPQPPAARALRSAPSYAAMAPAPAAVAPAPADNASAAQYADAARKHVPAGRTLSLTEDPSAVAAQWQSAVSLRVTAAEPDSEAVRDWVRRLWEAMPAGQRPPSPYAAQEDKQLAPGQLRIEAQ